MYAVKFTLTLNLAQLCYRNGFCKRVRFYAIWIKYAIWIRLFLLFSVSSYCFSCCFSNESSILSFLSWCVILHCFCHFVLFLLVSFTIHQVINTITGNDEKTSCTQRQYSLHVKLEVLSLSSCMYFQDAQLPRVVQMSGIYHGTLPLAVGFYYSQH